jgi:acetyl-CoA carboxylase carboxyl transferase subunit alpha
MDSFLDFEKPIAALEAKLEDLKRLDTTKNVDFQEEIRLLEEKLDRLTKDVFSQLTSLQRVKLSRHPKRPYTLDYIQNLFEHFDEFHGDRGFGEDPSLVGGLAEFQGQSVVVMGQQKGRKTKDKVYRNFGMVKPEGYRKSLRLMRLAERFKLPIVCFIDTPGAYPGIGAEQRGQAEVIAKNIMEMFQLKVPVISAVIGEGGSGGALALGVADRVLMQEYSTYSVISPESCASILWSDPSMNEKASEALKMGAYEVLDLGVIDEIIPEPVGGAHRNPDQAYEFMEKKLSKHIKALLKTDFEKLPSKRVNKFRSLGQKAVQNREELSE